MSVQVNCPHCLTPCEIPDHQADKVLSCGNCQKTFRMKTPAEPAPQTPAPAATTAKPPAKPAAADLAKAAKRVAPPPSAPKKAPAIDVLEVVDLAEEVAPIKPAEKKRPLREADANPLRDRDNPEPAERPAKKKRSTALLVLG